MILNLTKNYLNKFSFTIYKKEAHLFWYNTYRKDFPVFSTKKRKERHHNMYSPKVSEDLVPRLYKLAKEQKRPMTKVLDGLIRDKLVEQVSDKPVATESTNSEIKSKVA